MDAKENEKEIKVILLGDSGVGKTCIINRYINDEFNPNSKTTLGSNASSKVIKRGQVSYILNLWDTTGQEKYHSITNLFIKGSNIVVLVYSIDLLLSFKGLDYWYKSVQEKLGGNKYVLAVVGSKSDLIKNEEEEVSEEEAKKFAEEKNAIFKLVSSKEDPEGINNLFDTLLDELIKKNYLNENENENYVITRKNLVNKEKAKKKNRC
jgi:small GTP-binding protein